MEIDRTTRFLLPAEWLASGNKPDSALH